MIHEEFLQLTSVRKLELLKRRPLRRGEGVSCVPSSARGGGFYMEFEYSSDVVYLRTALEILIDPHSSI